MEGHIRKRGDKWYYSFEASSVEGKRKRIERVGGRTKKEAEAALRKAIQEYENAGLHFDPTDISFSDYLDHWHTNYVMVNLKYRTQCSYKIIINNHLKPNLGKYQLKSLTPAVLQGFVNNKYLSGMRKSSLINIISVLSLSLKMAVQPYGMIKASPMIYVKTPRYDMSKEQIDRHVIPNDDFEAIISRFPEDSQFHVPLMIGYHTGMRIGEVYGLTWDDVDLDAGTISINKIVINKNKFWYFSSAKTQTSVRTVKIGGTLIECLKKEKIRQAENRIRYGQNAVQQFLNVSDGQIISLPLHANSCALQPIKMVCLKESGEMSTYNSFKYASRVIHYELGITFNFHSLRHTHATTLIENGANIKDVQNRLGHKNIETTLGTYTHATEKMADQSIIIFEKVIKEGKKKTS